MEYRYLGNSGLKISALILGNWLTHGAQIEDKAAYKCIDAALEAGINTFDTADVYANTKAEKVLGKALREQRRESLVLMTKAYWPVGPKGPNDCGLSRKHIMDSVHGSLKRLHTDYIDVFQAHRFDYHTPLEETIGAFADLVHQGKVHYLGVSEWTADQVRAGSKLAKDMGIQLLSNQSEYSLLWRPIERDVIPALEEEKMSLLCFSPLAQGVLTGKYRPGEKHPSGSRATDSHASAFMQDYLSKNTLSHVQGLRRVAEEAGCKMNHLALAWLLSKPVVAGVIIGASKASQVEDNVKALKVRFKDRIYVAIDEALGDTVQRDADLVKDRSPKDRPC